MTPNDIETIESSCAIRLPAFYSSFLLSYPAELAATYTYFSSQPREYVTSRQLRNSATDLIALNRDLRRPGTPWTADDGPWPDRFFAIGDDVCGGYFSIDLQSQSEAVFYYEHETGHFIAEHDSLTAFATTLIAEATAWNSEHEPPNKSESPTVPALTEDTNQLRFL